MRPLQVFSLVTLLVLAAGRGAAAGEERAGLLTTVEAASGESWNAVFPKVAGVWPEGHAPHPSIPSERFTVRWSGSVRIPRAAKYRFSAIVRGRFVLEIGGKRWIGTEAADGHPGAGADAVLLEGPWGALEPGDLALTASFEKTGSAGRVQLLWESEDFARVPVPAKVLFHDVQAESEALALDRARDRGKALYEENRCTACHVRAGARSPEKGPDLTNAGTRLRAPWLLRWLEDPAAVRPGTPMPRMFTDDVAGAREREDVVRYLTQATPAEPPKPAPKGHQPDAARGKVAFAARGCVACHEVEALPARSSGDTGPVTLREIGAKYEPRALAAFLENPAASHPGGRMPSVALDSREREDVAEYLTTLVDDRAEPALEASRDDAASIERGRAIVRARCLSCHEVRGEIATELGAVALDAGLPNGRLGCASGEPPAPRKPSYTFAEGDRRALTAYLSSPARPAPSESLTHDAARTLDQFQCLQCHERDGEGGGLYERQVRFVGESSASRIQQASPPDLTGIGSKLRSEWMREMFERGTRARPWLETRMPHFGVESVARLAEGFAALDGEEAAEEFQPAPPRVGAGIAGRDLVGKDAFNCIACHDLAGASASVAFPDTRGPDLTLTPSRVRKKWYRAWLLDPQALSPGTKMPAYFPGGASVLEGRHGLDAEGQMEALYEYFSLGEKAPLPAGLGNVKGWSWVPAGRPVSLRTPLDGAPRSICVGFPGGVSFAFDAERGRLHAWWQGGFLRMDGTQWTGNHGPYPSPEGTVLYRAEGMGVPMRWFEVGGAEVSPLTPRFLGYSMRAGNLAFETRWSDASGRALTVSERWVGGPPRGLTPEGTRLDRHVAVDSVPAGLALRLLAAEGASMRVHALSLPEGAALEREGNDGLTRTWVSIPASKAPRGIEFSVAVTYDAAPKPAGALPESWTSERRGADAFEAAPRVAATFDGVPVKGEKPFALEEKCYRIESIPVPNEIILQGGGLDFLPNGSLAVCTRRGEVWILENATLDPAKHRWRRFAEGLHEPLGLKVVEGTIYVLQKPELTRLRDSDGDGVCDRYETVSAGWGLSTNFHEFAFGLEHDGHGNFYGTLGLAIIPGGATRPEQVFARGGAFRVGEDGSFEVLALGARTPNGTGLGPTGELYYTDNQGDYIPACKLTSVKRGEFYGQRFALPDRDAVVEVTPPVCWFPYGHVSQSATDVLLEDRDGRFGPFTGQLLVGELTNSQVLRVQLETVRGREQGTVWIFRRGFASGVNRLCFGPDDALYVAQTTGGWGARGAKLFALEKVVYEGRLPFEMQTVHLTKDGFEIAFTKPLAKEPAVSDASVEQFRYHYWATYGSPEIDRKAVKVTRVWLSPDGKTLTIECPGLEKERICEIRLRGVTSRDGDPLAHAECWYTLNEFPD